MLAAIENVLRPADEVVSATRSFLVTGPSPAGPLGE
jgi:hypothetical protein